MCRAPRRGDPQHTFLAGQSIAYLHINLHVGFDIADDLHWKSHHNYTLNHFMERVKIYNSEKFNYKNVVIQLEGMPNE